MTPLLKHTLPFLTGCGIALLSSCTSFSVPVYTPAKYDLGKGENVTIDSYNDSFSHEIKRSLARNTRNDGYYTYIGRNNEGKGKPAYVLFLNWSRCYLKSYSTSEAYTEEDSDGKTVTRFRSEIMYSATAEVSLSIKDAKRNKVLSSPSFSTSTGDYNSSFAAEDVAADLLSYQISDFITPKVEYNDIRIWSRRANPLLEKSAVACKDNDWPLAKTYALEALQITPDEPELNYLMGIIEQVLQNFDSAHQYFTKAASLSDNSKYSTAVAENESQRQNFKRYQSQMNPKR